MNPYKAKLKTKKVHGVRTGHHDNPHVIRAARRDGGHCDGDSAPKNLGRMGRLRLKKADGGSVDWQAGGRALSGLAGLGMPSPASAAPAAAPGGQDDLSSTQRAGEQLMNLSTLGMRKRGGVVRKAGGGAISDEDAKRMGPGGGATSDMDAKLMTRKADGGSVAKKHLDQELDEHETEHRLMAQRKNKE